MWHRLAHWLGWNTGSVKSWWRDGQLIVAFECARCGRITGEHPVPDLLDPMSYAWGSFPDAEPR